MKEQGASLIFAGAQYMLVKNFVSNTDTYLFLKAFVVLATIIASLSENYVNQNYLRIHQDLLAAIIRHHTVTGVKVYDDLARCSRDRSSLMRYGRKVFPESVNVEVPANTNEQSLSNEWLQAEMNLRASIPSYNLATMFYGSLIGNLQLLRYASVETQSMYILMTMLILPLILAHMVDKGQSKHPLLQSLDTLLRYDADPSISKKSK